MAILMNEEIKKILQSVYANHKLKEEDLDYTVIQSYKSHFDRIAQVSNRCFFIVDLYTLTYAYISENFKDILGYIPVYKSGTSYDEELLDTKIHPDDFLMYKKDLLRVGEFLTQKPKEERPNYKHIYELRMRNIQNEYVRVSWERKALETDKSGNLWLMLGEVHVLSDQGKTAGIKSIFMNQKTGELIRFDSPEKPQFNLTKREKEVLGFIQQGLLTKEIAERLFISVHTVKIHRQKILEKMQVNNSLEAVEKARMYGILS